MLAAGVVAASMVAAQARPDTIEVAFIANAEEATIAMVDVAARSVIGSVAVNFAEVVGEGPGAPNYAQDTDVSPDGRTLYVSRGYLGDVAAFDIASGRPQWTRPLNTLRADHMTLSPDGRDLFVSAMVDNRVYRVSTESGAITGHVAAGVFPHDVKISRDGRRLYNSSLGRLSSFPVPPGLAAPALPVQLTIADAQTLEVRERIAVETAMRPWHFNKDESGIYAQLSNQHAVVFFDLAAKQVIRRLDLPIAPGVTAKDWDFEAPHHGLALTDDGTTLCLAGRASDYAALVRAPELTLIGTVPVGDAPGWAETAQGGTVCLVANSRSDDLSIISIADRKEVVRLPIGNGPKHITIARIPAAVVAAARAR